MDMQDILTRQLDSLNPIQIMFTKKYRGGEPQEKYYFVDESSALLLDENNAKLTGGKN